MHPTSRTMSSVEPYQHDPSHLDATVRSLRDAGCDRLWRLTLNDQRQVTAVASWGDESPSGCIDFAIGEWLDGEQDRDLLRISDGSRFVLLSFDTSQPSLGIGCGSSSANWIESLIKQIGGRWEIEQRFDALESSLQEAIAVNDALVSQISDDFEEITFLRSMAEHLECFDPGVDPIAMAHSLVARLRQSARAHCLAMLVPDSAQDWKVASLDGESPLTPTQLSQLIAQIGSETVNGPLVLNDPKSRGIQCIDSLLAVRLASRDEIFGYLVALNRQKGPVGWCEARLTDSEEGEFGTAEATTMSSAAAILSAHWQNVRLLRQKEDLLTSVIRALVSAIDAKDPYTRGHSDRVALFAACVAKHLGLSAQRQEKIYLTGLLHDIGKIAVSDATLRKAGRLDPAEFEEIKKHPDEGWAILQGIPQLQDVIPGVLYHHERVDGQGYPDGLAGSGIPLEGRILAVVDAFDAMTSDRPYRKGMPFEKAISILREGAGTQWDARVLAAFDMALPEIEEIARSYRTPDRPVRLKPKVERIETFVETLR